MGGYGETSSQIFYVTLIFILRSLRNQYVQLNRFKYPLDLNVHSSRLRVVSKPFILRRMSHNTINRFDLVLFSQIQHVRVRLDSHRLTNPQ